MPWNAIAASCTKHYQRFKTSFNANVFSSWRLFLRETWFFSISKVTEINSCHTIRFIFLTSFWMSRVEAIEGDLSMPLGSHSKSFSFWNSVFIDDINRLAGSQNALGEFIITFPDSTWQNTTFLTVPPIASEGSWS